MKFCKYFIAAYLFLSVSFNSVFSQNERTVKIGVALPLFLESGDNSKKQLGTEILNGIRFALSQYSSSSPPLKVILEVLDTRRDPSLTREIISGFAIDEDVIGVIGPVYSSEFSEILSIPEENSLPVISPTATGDNIAKDNYIYQLNPTYEVRGRLMADYLVRKMNMKNFAVMYESSYGINFSKYFESHTNDLGCKILFSESYSKEPESIRNVIAKLKKFIKEKDLFVNASNLNITQRQKLERAGVRSSLIDSSLSLNMDISIYYIFGKNARKILDTMNIKPSQLTNELKFIQGIIDAVYIPVSNSSDISIIVPQLYSESLGMFIAGTGDWNNEIVINDNRIYIRDLIFESEYYIDETSDWYREFKGELSKTKYKLSKNFLFGYDAMKLILDLISDGSTTRSSLNDKLKNLTGYDATKSKISLDYRGVNSELNILRLGDGITLSERYKLNIQD